MFYLIIVDYAAEMYFDSATSLHMYSIACADSESPPKTTRGAAVPAPLWHASCYCYTTQTSSDMEIVLEDISICKLI